MHLRRQILALLAMLLAQAKATAQTQAIARVSALADGQLLLNGQPTTLSSLSAAFKRLKEANGVVWYYRESGRGEPTPEAMSAVKLIVEHSLPVSMSSKPDFSDHIDATGKSMPRQKQ
jgi:hypothetical protein